MFNSSDDAYLHQDEDVKVILAGIDALPRSGVKGSVVDARGPSLTVPKKVLTVDGNPSYLHVLAEELRKDGYEVLAAGTAREALQLLDIQTVDCILMDLCMPDLSGQETCQIIKKRPEWRNIPLVILTSVDDSRAMIEGMNAGADDCVVKSADFEVLRARVRSQLRRKQIEAEYLNVSQSLERAVMVDELERKNREMDGFMYSISHDLRSPLRAIQGFSRILQEESAGELTPDTQRCLGRVVTASRLMAEMIEALLLLARVGRVALKRQSIDVSRLVRAIAGELAQSGPERAVEFVIEDDVRADADPVLIRSVLENLLGNAWKFTRNVESAKVQMGTRREEAGLVYFVRDNGAGFDPALADKMFAPFQRMHSESAFPGIGTGLATVQRIVGRHGGRVWAESAVGQGAAFFFTLGLEGQRAISEGGRPRSPQSHPER
jgi:signal transduction histidine kinase